MEHFWARLCLRCHLRGMSSWNSLLVEETKKGAQKEKLVLLWAGGSIIILPAQGGHHLLLFYSWFLHHQTSSSCTHSVCVYVCVWVCVWGGGCVLVSQSCLTLWNLMDCNLPGSSAHGILQARINPGLLHCRQILYHLSHRGSPAHTLGFELTFN